jgi:hypothetical protein
VLQQPQGAAGLGDQVVTGPEVPVVDRGQDLLQVRDRAVPGLQRRDQRRDDRTGAGASHPPERVARLREFQHRPHQAQPFDAAAFEDQVGLAGLLAGDRHRVGAAVRGRR